MQERIQAFIVGARYFARTVTILGHTPTSCYGPEYAGKMLRTDTWIDIDTGAVSPGGHPMLLRLEDETPFYPAESSFYTSK